MENVNYRTYQQVLNIVVNTPSAVSSPKKVSVASTKKASVKVEKPAKVKAVKQKKKETPPAKRRTKSGCLTCRKRKKKCDEDTVNGKCQGCTRNFLECCWPGAEPASACSSSSSSPTESTSQSVLPTPATTPLLCPTSPLSSPTKIITPHNPIPYKRTPTSDVSARCSIKSLLAPIQDAYPSPANSPEGSPVQTHKEVPRYLSCESKNETQCAKFIITSFNRHNDLCSVE